MINSFKFITFTNSLDTADWKRFRRFLKSPYFNTNLSLLKLADIIRKFHPWYDQEDCTKEKIFAAIYKKEKKYSEAGFNTLMRTLMKLGNQFLIHQQLDKEENMQRQLKLKALKDKQLDDWFFKEAERQKNYLSLEVERDEEYHYAMFLLNRTIYNHPLTTKNKMILPALTDSLYHLQQYMIWNSVQWTLIVKNRESVTNYEQDTTLMNKIIDNVSTEASQDIHLSFSIKLLQYLDDSTEDFLDNLTTAFFKNYHNFSGRNGQYFFYVFLNILIPKIRTGNKIYLKMVFDIYKVGFSKRILFENDVLSVVTFINAIVSGCSNKNFKWVENMMESYGKYLPTSIREDAIKYGQLNYYYLLGNDKKDKRYYQKTIDIFQNIDVIPDIFGFSIRSILVRSHFELLDKSSYDTEFLEYFCISFQKYVKRNQVFTERKKQIYFEFIRNVQKLIYFVQLDTIDKQKHIAFEMYLDQNNNIFAHQWFVEKLRELK